MLASNVLAIFLYYSIKYSTVHKLVTVTARLNCVSFVEIGAIFSYLKCLGHTMRHFMSNENDSITSAPADVTL
jgi:hypothetical protein